MQLCVTNIILGVVVVEKLGKNIIMSHSSHVYILIYRKEQDNSF